jgi:hypothetical protein
MLYITETRSINSTSGLLTVIVEMSNLCPYSLYILATGAKEPHISHWFKACATSRRHCHSHAGCCPQPMNVPT